MLQSRTWENNIVAFFWPYVAYKASSFYSMLSFFFFFWYMAEEALIGFIDLEFLEDDEKHPTVW